MAAVDASARTVTFRRAELFGGEQADIEARKDGREEGAPNPFYVREGTTVETLPVDPAARVVVIAYDAEGNASPAPTALPLFFDDPAIRGPNPLFWFDIADGRVVGLEQVMSP